MWTCRFLSGVPFDTLRRGDGVREHAPRRVDGVRDAAMAREQTRVERRSDGVGAGRASTRPRGRESALGARGRPGRERRLARLESAT